MRGGKSLRFFLKYNMGELLILPQKGGMVHILAPQVSAKSWPYWSLNNITMLKRFRYLD